MTHNFKLNAISAAVIATCFNLPVLAQELEDEVEKKELENEIEIIEVTGFKGSIQKALNAKRFSENVSDSIHAEDVGKSTDQNIADALSRITGVTVQEDSGEGTRISVRGAGPSMNQISINGVALTGGISDPSGNGSNDNSIDLSSFSADILSSVDVVKTAAADQDEGSLGANVNLKTVRPLNLNKPRRSFTVEGRHNEFADDQDFRINASFSDKYFDDKFGFIITASKDTQNTRQDRINTGYEQGAIPIADLADATNLRKATDLESGMPIRVLGYQRDANGELLLDAQGQRQLNPIESLLDYDPATQKLVEGDLFVLARDSVNFSLSNNKRERFSVSSGFQYRPTDTTDIQLDLTYSKQQVYTDYQSLVMNISPDNLIHPGDDNVALNVVDLNTNTLQRSTSRSISGGFNRTTGLREIDTKVATLDINHELTNDLSMSFLVGYSKTTDETPDDNEADRWLSIGTATWGTAGRTIVEAQPSERLELVGYDCTQGSTRDCNYFTGTQNAIFDALDGSTNYVTSRFNPYDLEHNHLGNLNFRKNELVDENKSVFLDFDWVLDFEHVTKVEFGVKWADRSRSVSINNTNVTNGAELIDVDDPSANFEVRGLGTIRVADFVSGEAFPYNNFAEDIQGNRSNAFFGGWAQLDAEKALELVGGKDAGELGVRHSRAGTREIATETVAAYFKTNFEFMDGKLTGNIGVRYVEDNTDATGLGGINYIRFPQMLDPYDLIVNRGLANMDNPACPEAVIAEGSDTRYTPANDDQLRNCWSYTITHAYNFNNAATIPFESSTGEFVIPGADGIPGPDVNRMLFVDASGNIIMSNELPSQIYDRSGNLVPTSASDWARFNSNGLIWPFLDRSTAFTGPNGDGQEVQQREAAVSDKAKNKQWLPSLNLNYALNEDTIVRFALTKTMTRPNFDSLNPANTIRESQFNASNGRAGNTGLKNLTSKNVDFSYEWYFDESGLLSAALFYKDMSNFEENIVTPFHYKDVRDQIPLENANLLLDFDANRTPGDADKCHPHRLPAGFFNQWTIECDVANINFVKNGKGATIKGIEIGYTQNYNELPGLLSGLGVSANYTYQDSERDVELIGTTGRTLRPLPQPFTPKHSANFTLFWEKDGTQMRLAHRYNGVQAVSQSGFGAVWQDATNRLDFSASYRINKNFSLTFNALNLTDDTIRNFFTASGTTDVTNANSQEVVLDEGNVLDNSDVTRDRTVAAFKTGRQFRFGLRGTF
ncbi:MULTISPECIES: TonB-dependent receptor [Aliiglaciecola]|uniref:TonB-dependent receptor n=1 Tax=Aliiglaciecola TaxID=1406885 RepID=UPI001C09CD82|nr:MULTISPECIES: TonB-dependent receptor [Aliiglaciecola]MBU2878961.1 TonB-dependent receptor [Aliiglaciecola lipolytica]MDO6710662.1 TonB-dependent receptor [Aliiglaciecola sp. 2_MG-2023]MDO6751930.1 TonB-dependent receptor [Aliiglaciecola sp. 1_MG-2023]